MKCNPVGHGRVVGLVTLVLLTAAAYSTALAQSPTVEFLAPAGTEILQTDMVIFTGKPLGTVDVTGCFAPGGFHSLQAAIVVDPGSGNTPKQIVVIPLNFTDASGTYHVLQDGVRPGTRLIDPFPAGNCSTSQGQYTKWVAHVS